MSYTEGPLLILAGAGSGKTRVITHRIAHIITSRQVPPSAILAVTFTNKAAERDARAGQRLCWKTSALDSSPNVSTFHSFCVRLLRRDGDPLARIRPGFTRRFSIYDDEDQLGIIKSVYRALGLDEKEFLQYRAALSRISHAKKPEGDAAGHLQELPSIRKPRSVAAVFEEYEKALRIANALDFDDLLLEAVRLLQTRRRHARSLEPAPELRDGRRVPGHQPHPVRADAPALRIARQCLRGGRRRPVDLQLARRRHPQYSGFRARFSQRPTIRLEQNYRSTKNILAAAGAVVENNKARKGKKLWTEADAGVPLGLYAGYDAENEALFIADTIEKHLASPTPATMWRSSTAPIPSRGRSKRRCGATGASTTWSAASVFISGPKSRTLWRT